ncbi:hypothetical protein [Dermatophilus congolensis]|uniref:hypothetical protein n=1 Tax=Dermatophilus congolensis TaxID=1863 RepID=UPI001AAF4144|nr:hypothetical protein [Dermatophilus congolensis]MBO3143994.1 hypothetical protein [Dermatophilus congolensis]MBO3152984.1 hypothetical protein [Dermatophilus congolensis]MBO3164272.1 hypothetical protein [Dermatophilus congolensis]MBO3177816.1 hypothetical protein [Dermatophilus congolensis]MBO3200569.1 hypothetical protein [Dermatophilus congolensis]
MSRLRLARRSLGARVSRVLPVAMLFVVSLLTALLWMRAVVVSWSAVSWLSANDVVTARSVGCVDGVCRAQWPGGQIRVIHDPGLFAPQQGNELSVVERGGVLHVAGWSAVSDAVLLVFLAVCFTGFMVSWMRRVLESAPIVDEDVVGEVGEA